MDDQVNRTDTLDLARRSGWRCGSLQFNRQFVDLGGEDEVVLRQATDGVRPDLDGHVAITHKMQVGMMAFGFGDLCHLLKEPHRGHEIFDDPLFPNPFTLMSDRPAVQLRELSLGFGSRQLWDSPFARKALLRTQLLDSLNSNDLCPLSDEVEPAERNSS